MRGSPPASTFFFPEIWFYPHNYEPNCQNNSNIISKLNKKKTVFNFKYRTNTLSDTNYSPEVSARKNSHRNES